MGIWLSHQRGQVGNDFCRFGLDRQISFLHHAAEHEGETNTERNGQEAVGRGPVADDG
jgi:hypothetical protein